ncbi:DNA polymerase III subunit delta [Oenococcus sp. UCMA 16435]|nr:DNA polymerase III subunit delta [Oenococcus sp. UCMA 16435]MDI4584040.1 DNA polymerase III subunit delta [Oenococcus sp. UCMA 14587]
MTPSDFKKQIKNKQLPALIFFTGTEDFLTEQSSNLLENSIDENFRAWDFVKANTENESVKEVLADISTLSFNASRRIVIVENPLFLTAKNSLEKNEENLLLKYLSSPESENSLIINAVNLTLDKRKKTVKNLIKTAENVDFKPLNERQILQIVKRRFSAADISVEDTVLNYYFRRLAFNLRLIVNNLDKLLLYGQSHLIDNQSIDFLIAPESTESAFDLIEAINQKKPEKVIKIYEDLIDRGEAPIRINALLQSQYRLLLQAKSLKLNDQNLSRLLRIHPYRAKLANQEASLKTYSELSNSFLNLSDIELKLKSTRLDPKMLFEIFLSKNV